MDLIRGESRDLSIRRFCRRKVDPSFRWGRDLDPCLAHDLLDLLHLGQIEPSRVVKRQAEKAARLVSVAIGAALQQADRQVRASDQ